MAILSGIESSSTTYQQPRTYDDIKALAKTTGRRISDLPARFDGLFDSRRGYLTQIEFYKSATTEGSAP